MGRWGKVAAGLALVLGAGHGFAQRAGESAIERVFAAPRTPTEIRRRLAALEVDELPDLFRLAAAGELHVPSGTLVPSGPERELVRESLAARPRRELVPLLEDLACRPMERAERAEAQRLLGLAGTAEHLKLLVRLTTAPHERGLLGPALRNGFADAFGAILARDPAAFSQVPGLVSESPAAVASSIVEALARQAGDGATRALAGLLGRSPGLDPLLLARLAERPGLHGGGNEAVLDGVRRYLRQRDPALVAAAARVCGRLGDDGAVEGLISLGDHADERVRRSAFDALREITGLDHGPESARWASWYQAETRWWDEEADGELAHVERGRGVEFARAARGVLEHRLNRDRIVEAFLETLRRGGMVEARLACRALAQLGSPLAVRGLVECLENTDPELREAAWQALCAITGLALPPEADSWAPLVE